MIPFDELDEERAELELAHALEVRACLDAIDEAWRAHNGSRQIALNRAMDHLDSAYELAAQIEQLRTAA